MIANESILCCLRHLNGVTAMHEKVQQCFHIAESVDMPVPHSTYSDGLNSASRRIFLRCVVEIARKRLPDRFKKISELGNRPIFALDGTYQEKSAHYPRSTPKNGSDDNHKGYRILALFDVRMGIPIEVTVERKNIHETLVLKNYFS